MENHNNALSSKELPKGFSTRAIHTGQEPEQWDSRCINPPIVMSSIFKQYSPAVYDYEYGRTGNPTRTALEKCLAAIEDCKYCLCFSSGLAAVAVVMGLFQVGDHVICGDDVFGGTYRFLDKISPRNGVSTTFVEARDTQAIRSAITPHTKMVWIETPTNPSLKVIDIEAVAQITKEHNLLLIVDNTFLTPYFQKPLKFGADISMYSLTKYMNGHSDVIMGSLAFNDDKLYEKLYYLQYAIGAVPSPFDCALVNRGLKTLSVRLKQHSKSGMEIAEYLRTHPKVEKVMHPGFPDHPENAIFRKQSSGHSGVVSFYIKNGTLEHSKKFIKHLKYFSLAVSLGSFESLVSVPALMSHASVEEHKRKKLLITDNLIRLSVGLEETEDLIKAIREAFETI